MGAAALVLGPIVRVILIVLEILNWTILVWVVISWLHFFASQTSFRWRYRGAFNLLTQLDDIFGRMTYPFLKPFRRMLRKFDTAGIDWSPMLLWLTIFLLRSLIEGIYLYILAGSR